MRGRRGGDVEQVRIDAGKHGLGVREAARNAVGRQRTLASHCIRFGQRD